MTLDTWRAAQGLTQPQLADLLGVKLSTLRKWLYGVQRPRAAARERIAEVTGGQVDI